MQNQCFAAKVYLILLPGNSTYTFRELFPTFQVVDQAIRIEKNLFPSYDYTK